MSDGASPKKESRAENSSRASTSGADSERPKKKTKWDVEGPPPKPSPLPHVPLPGSGSRPVVRTKVLTIPAAHKGALIGKGGEAISAIRAASAAEIHIRHTESEPLLTVTISGSNVELAEKLIGERLAASGRTADAGWDLKIVDVPQELIGPTIGNGGCNLRELQERTGCKFKFIQANELDPSAAFGRQVACIRGPADKVPAGEKALLEKVAEVQHLHASKQNQRKGGAKGDGIPGMGDVELKGDPGGKGGCPACKGKKGVRPKGAGPWEGAEMPGFPWAEWDGVADMAWDGKGPWDPKGGWGGKGPWDGKGMDWYMAMWNSWWGGWGGWRGKKRAPIPCKFQMRGFCKNAERCTFSHDPDVIAAALGEGSLPKLDGSWDPGFKMAYCRFWDSGKCTRGATCTFAHGIDELRGGLTPENLALMEEAQQMMSSSLKPEEVERRLADLNGVAVQGECDGGGCAAPFPVVSNNGQTLVPEGPPEGAGPAAGPVANGCWCPGS